MNENTRSTFTHILTVKSCRWSLWKLVIQMNIRLLMSNCKADPKLPTVWQNLLAGIVLVFSVSIYPQLTINPDILKRRCVQAKFSSLRVKFAAEQVTNDKLSDNWVKRLSQHIDKTLKYIIYRKFLKFWHLFCVYKDQGCEVTVIPFPVVKSLNFDRFLI